MTTTQMVTHVRTLFDEDSAGFYTDDMIKRSLDNGQKILANMLYQMKRHNLLYTLETSSTRAYSVLTLPTDFWMYKSCLLNDYPCRLRTGDKDIKEGNSYLVGATTDPYIYVGSSIDFSPTPAGGQYTFTYYKNVSDITSTNPNLPSATHLTICQYAFADLLLRDSKHQEAVVEFEKFHKMVADL